MDESKLEKLLSKIDPEIQNILEEFNKQNAEIFNFEKVHTEDEWHKLWNAVFAILSDASLTNLHEVCLNTVRILTRNKQSLNKHDVGDGMSTLLKLAHLTVEDAGKPIEEGTTQIVVVESLKCLCNLVYQTAELRRKCVKKNALDAIFKRVASSTQYPSVVELFDMKLLFLLTALDSEARTKAQFDLNGTTYLTEWLKEKLDDSNNTTYTDEDLDVLSEILKVLFNITTGRDKSPNENEIQNMHLTGVIRDVLLCFGNMENERERCIIGHAINLLTNISSSCLTELSLKLDGESEPKEDANVLPFEGRNVRALDVLLRYLRHILDKQDTTATTTEILPPVLVVLVKCARGHPVMRHYIRGVILPPLKDVSNRPEVGNELRNHLCRFLTKPTTVVRDLATDLLFVLCKENVRRMIKYTGYGNAAGLFARRGILDCRRVENAQYSSDSENSDTEEYKQMERGINPVLGCYEAPKPSPLEGMSEEQKEYEAVQLANLMDKLHKSGIVQPCRIGEDGRPVPVDHILQLQEGLPKRDRDNQENS